MITDKKDYVIGIDIGGTTIKGGIVSPEGKIIHQYAQDTQAKETSDIIYRNILQVIEILLQEAKKQDLIIEGIGVGSPGCIDTSQGTILGGIDNIPSLSKFPLGSKIKEDTGKKVFVCNDATNAAIGEFIFGAGKDVDSFILMTLGTGIGGGIILNRKVHYGFSFNAGEIGHMTIQPEGKSCTCGKFGCFEAYASASAIIKQAVFERKLFSESSLNKYSEENITARLVFELAGKGDVLAKHIVQVVAKYIGIAIGNLLNLLNVELVLIGGGVSAAGNILFDAVDLHTRYHARPLPYEGVKIMAAEFQNDAGILGSAGLVYMEEEEKVQIK